jgi:sulfite exporter TauE/SafE
MSYELTILVATAASIGFFHTILGPDHYLPFIVMSRSGKWSIRKTALVTALCGIGHVLSSIVLGIFGISLGIAVSKLELVESFRGTLAAWVLIAFGLIYLVWGIRRALRNKPHKHIHAHRAGNDHVHTHVHTEEHVHVHRVRKTKTITPWVLFVIFILGPCEPLIPVLMYPAAQSSMAGLILVAGIFGGVTLLTMLGVVLMSTYGINLIPTERLERYTHAIAGGIICFCGISILFVGL